MKRLVALFCAALLCGSFLIASCVPVSAAGEPETMLYNGVELPKLPEWDKDIYLYAWIKVPDAGKTRLFVSSCKIYVDGNFFRTEQNCVVSKYTLVDGVWELVSSNVDYVLGSNIESVNNNVIWANFDILNTNGSIYLAASTPVDLNAPVGTMEIQSVQPLDDSASFTVFVSGVALTSAYTLKYILSVDGQEVKSEVSDPFEDSATGLHGTLYGLTPETTYDLTCILQKDGVDTSITASTTFTTLAGSGAGEGEGEDDTPDYSGQLGDIEQGLDDVQESVDKVGTKLDGVKEAVGAVKDAVSGVKEEVASLPNKIATAILDGIKKLFVPSQEDLSQIKTDYEDMLSEKLGFVWQGFDLLTTFVSDLQTSLESGEEYAFNFPGVKLPMQGEEFVLVPETAVSLENDLMDVLRPVLGIVVSMISVIAFVNMAHDYVLAIISGVSAYQFERRKE